MVAADAEVELAGSKSELCEESGISTLAPPEVRPTLFGGQPPRSLLQWYSPPLRPYSRRELVADRIINFSGAGLSWVGTAVLVHASWAAGDSLHKQMGFWAHGFGMIAMLNCSAMYHYSAWRWTRARQLLSLDHFGISAMIAGSYAPVMLQLDGRGVLAIVILLGVLGVVMEACKLVVDAYRGPSPAGPSLLGKLHIVRYLIMGWAVVLILPRAGELPLGVQVLSLAAGLLYSGGVYFCVNSGIEFHQAIWHGFVAVASLLYYLASLLFLVGLPLP